MERWRLVYLGPRDGYFIQAVYEAIAKFVGSGRAPPTLVVTWPSHPYVCIGVHQVPELEVDTEFCRSRGLPIVRRQVGGGAVYLDENQVFYHVVVPKSHRLYAGGVEGFFRRVLGAVVRFYRSYGLPAEYKPVNDVVIRGRKASGNGAALLHGAAVLIGNVILDFDADTAARILRLPDEKLRSYVASSMKEWVTSLKRELGYAPPREEVVEGLVRCFSEELGIELVKGGLGPGELREAEAIAGRMRSREWLYGAALGREYLLARYRPGARLVKIREGHFIAYAEHRGVKTVRVVLEAVDGDVRSLLITGDFFVQPPHVVEEVSRRVTGASLGKAPRVAEETAEELFREATAAGVSPRDIGEAVRRAVELIVNA